MFGFGEEPNEKFVSRIKAALELAYHRTQAHETSIDVRTAKIIIFSDHHRGIRNGADDFRLSEAAYHAALAYYFNLGYTLIVLGDVEELWEEHPEPVMEKNAYSFGLESKFHREGRYHRIWGNHDDEWSDPKQVEKLLQPKYGDQALIVTEGLHIHVLDGKAELGSLFLTHGHQGTKDSDMSLGVKPGEQNKMAIMAKWLVHNVWRNVQRLTKISVNTPAKSWELNQRHDKAMYHWAVNRPKTILISGHTHQPVFASDLPVAELLKRLSLARRELAKLSNPVQKQQKQEQIAQFTEQLALAKQEKEQVASPGQAPLEYKPCYFNTGCCSYSDGDVTGLEISDGLIRLVRWEHKNGEAFPEILIYRPLAKVFSELT